MKVLIFIIFALTALAKADRDLSKFKPSHIYVKPKIVLPFQSRIVGGKVADPHQFPHQVALFTNRNTLCGGSIIAASVILTAAHCLDGVSVVGVIAGAHNLEDHSETTQQIIATVTFKIHEQWDRFKTKNDIALIYLPQPLTLNAYVKVLALYRGNSDLNKREATVSGWGKISDQAISITDKLRFVTSRIISDEDCKRFFGHHITESVVCLDGAGGKGSCSGDSGGPLHIAENNQLLQGGIVSFGAADGCQLTYPSAFTRISSFISWIDKNMPK